MVVKSLLNMQQEYGQGSSESEQEVVSVQVPGSSWVFKGDQWILSNGEGQEVNLIYMNHQKLAMKDFGREARALMDIEGSFWNTIILDSNETSLEGIINQLLQRLLEDDKELNGLIDEIKMSLFPQNPVEFMGRMIQGTQGHSFDYDHSWLCSLHDIPLVQKRIVGIVRLKNFVNLGVTCQKVRFFILVLCPVKQKQTKSSLETGRTIATLLCDSTLRQNLLDLDVENVEGFRELLRKRGYLLAKLHTTSPYCEININLDQIPLWKNIDEDADNRGWCLQFGLGIKNDLQRRLPYYWSDFVDGIKGPKRTLQKTLSTTFFLYFSILLPSIAFGTLNDRTTNGVIDVKKVIVGQTIGGIVYAILSGQPLNIIMTTAPLCLYIKILYSLSETLDTNFETLYCLTGLWSSFFLLVFAFFQLSDIMKFSTRSTEEIFSIFISTSFFIYALRDTINEFKENYFCTTRIPQNDSSNHFLMYMTPGVFLIPQALNDTSALFQDCHRDTSILFLLIMFGTVIFGLKLYNFNKTPYLSFDLRETLAEYALPLSVVIFTGVGALFHDVKLDKFRYNEDKEIFSIVPVTQISLNGFLWTIGLGLSLSILIFMDQNISSAMVNNPSNGLRKGSSYHWDLVVVSLINGVFSLFTLPFLHAALPHSPLHVRSLADVEDHIKQGHVYERIVRVRETRLSSLLSHILIGLSLMLLPFPLGHISNAVLDGLFLYMAVTALIGNQMFERLALIFTEQAQYPPNYYIRSVPQTKIHQFTIFQLIQLLAMITIGFVPWPYVKMAFPVTLLVLLVIRQNILPLFIEKKYLDSLDGRQNS